MRERRPGVWEIRIAVGTDPVTARTLQRSVTYRGSAAEADLYRSELAAEYRARRSVTRAAPLLTVAELLERWLIADHPWKPSTAVGHRSNVRHLVADQRLAQLRVVSLTPLEIRRTFARWEATGASASVVGGRFRVLRAAIGWAYDERIIDHHPIRSMRGPGRPEPRRPLEPEELTRLLAVAEHQMVEAVANVRIEADPGTWPNRICSSSAWPPTRVHDAASSQPCSSVISMAGCCTSAVPRQRTSSTPPNPATAERSRSARAPPACGGSCWVTGRPDNPRHWGRGCSAPTLATITDSPRKPSATASPDSVTPPRSRTPHFIGSATTSPPSSSPAARSSKPNGSTPVSRTGGLWG